MTLKDISRHRFVMSPTQEMKNKLAEQSKEIQDETSNLDKKLHYLETTAKNSREHIETILNSGRA